MTKTKTKHDTASDCISHPSHGVAYGLNGGRLWCPHQSHDMPEGGTPWLDEQAKAKAEADTKVEATA